MWPSQIEWLNLDMKKARISLSKAPNVSGYGAAFQEIANRGVDIMMATGPEENLRAAIAAAGARPIVMIAVDFDPFARGYVESLARPGGNITGLFFQQPDLAVKRAQLLRDAFPALSPDPLNQCPLLGVKLTLAGHCVFVA
jgi:ABC-type uncharacterized transport system substrate-binding protein